MATNPPPPRSGAARLWQGETTCNLCNKPIKGNLYDARLVKGSSWATMCQRCFSFHGIGLGLGYGQEYTEETNPDGKIEWIKTKG